MGTSEKAAKPSSRPGRRETDGSAIVALRSDLGTKSGIGLICKRRPKANYSESRIQLGLEAADIIQLGEALNKKAPPERGCSRFQIVYGLGTGGLEGTKPSVKIDNDAWGSIWSRIWGLRGESIFSETGGQRECSVRHSIKWRNRYSPI